MTEALGGWLAAVALVWLSGGSVEGSQRAFSRRRPLEQGRCAPW